MNGFLDIQKAAAFLCRSPRWVRGNIGWLPHFRVHSQILFRADELLRAMERFRVEPKEVDISALLDRVVQPRRQQGSGGRFRGGGDTR